MYWRGHREFKLQVKWKSIMLESLWKKWDKFEFSTMPKHVQFVNQFILVKNTLFWASNTCKLCDFRRNWSDYKISTCLWKKVKSSFKVCRIEKIHPLTTTSKAKKQIKMQNKFLSDWVLSILSSTPVENSDNIAIWCYKWRNYQTRDYKTNTQKNYYQLPTTFRYPHFHFFFFLRTWVIFTLFSIVWVSVLIWNLLSVMFSRT